MSDEEEILEEEIDPRIKGELDILNQSTDAINRLETELNDFRAKFKASLEAATQKLQAMVKKYGKSIERARPYYQTKAEVKQAQLAQQRAVNNFRKANGVYQAAKETIALAERRLSEFEDKKVDTTWQEVLNQQTMKFNDAENDRRRSQGLHEKATKKYEFLEKKMQALQKKHKNSTAKAKPYFELKELLEIDLQKKRQKVDEIQRKVEGAKKQYRQSLENLENISSEIHEKRRQSQKRIEGLGQLTVDASSDVEDGAMTNNPLDLDVIGLKRYDDVAELEADLNDFSLESGDDDDEDPSTSESESESGGSTPRIDRKRPQLKRSNTAPERRMAQARISRQEASRSALKRRPHVIKRAASVNASSSSCRSKRAEEGPENEGDGSFHSSNRPITTIAEDAEDEHQRIGQTKERDEATYTRLHGTDIHQENTENPPPQPKPKKALPAPEKFDIFDDLC